MIPDSKIISELKEYWGCEEFVFIAEFSNKTKKSRQILWPDQKY